MFGVLPLNCLSAVNAQAVSGYQRLQMQSFTSPLLVVEPHSFEPVRQATLTPTPAL